MRRFIFVFLVILLIFSSGCYTLRKKFVRKKRYQTQQPVYIDFKDYPEKPNKEAYLDYYLFVIGWIDELRELILQDGNFKRQKLAIKEAIVNLEQIIAFFNNEGKEKIYPLYLELLSIQQQINKNKTKDEVTKNIVIKRIDDFKRQFKKDFSYTDATRWME